MNGFHSSPIEIPKLRAGKPEITMAPLIDVVFLLLIFFMATTIFPDNHGLVIERPTATSAESLPGKPLRFLVDKEGVIHYQNREITVEEVMKVVSERLSMDPHSRILLDVDRRAATEALIRVMDAGKRAGARQIAIVTELSPADGQ